MKRKFIFGNPFLARRFHAERMETGGLYSVVRYILLCCRFMGLLPLSGLMSHDSSKLRFSTRSPYMALYIFNLIGQLSMCATSILRLIHNGTSLNNITNSLFYTYSLTSTLILLNIAKSWSKIMTTVEDLESKLPPFRRNVTRLANTAMAFILLAALVEHLLSLYFGISIASVCSKDNIAETFSRNNMPWIFDYTSYALWKGIIGEVINIQSTFMWSFSDLLIMVISIYLTEHFITQNLLIKEAVSQQHYNFEQFRKQHLKIVKLVKLINNHIGIYIVTSLGGNLYWVCVQLFYSLNKNQSGHFVACHQSQGSQVRPYHGKEHTIYFTFSFTFLKVRTVLVLFMSARIHSSSTVPLSLLYEVPSYKFDLETERFVSQITNLKVALSGYDFFYVTKTMILTLLGTIVTYELVLLQFNKY